jgi:hypothetical protein
MCEAPLNWPSYDEEWILSVLDLEKLHDNDFAV